MAQPAQIRLRRSLRPFSRGAAVGVVLFALGLGTPGVPRSAQARTRTRAPVSRKLKRYRNRNYNFLFAYPAAWPLYEDFALTGANLSPRFQDQAPPQAAISVGGYVVQASAKDDSRLKTLQEDFDQQLEQQKTQYQAKNLVVVSREAATIEGLPAIRGRVEMDAGDPAQRLVLEEILIHRTDEAVGYRLYLLCLKQDVALLAPYFYQILTSFRILGPAA